MLILYTRKRVKEKIKVSNISNAVRAGISVVVEREAVPPSHARRGLRLSRRMLVSS